MIIWFTGLPGAGKTTLMKLMPDNFIGIDADVVREVYPEDFTEEGRRRNVQRIQETAATLNAHGYDVAVACIAPYRDQREAFKAKHDVMEFYLPGGHWDESYGPNIYEPPR
jgi:adenylylsulfate kinase-like enzyme